MNIGKFSVSLSFILVAAVLLFVVVTGLFLGWAFNCAYYSALSDTQYDVVKTLSVSSSIYGPNIVPYTRRVFEVFLLVQIATAFLCGLLTVWRRVVGTTRIMMVMLILTFLLPVLFYLFAAVSRTLTENGSINVTDFVTSPELQPGESVMIAGLKYTKHDSGVAVENLLDRRSVLAIFIDSAEGVWVNNPLLILVTATLLLAIVARMVLLLRRARQSATKESS